jgi:hypothetical protein
MLRSQPAKLRTAKTKKHLATSESLTIDALPGVCPNPQVFSAICVVFAHGAGEVGYMTGAWLQSV